MEHEPAAVTPAPSHAPDDLDRRFLLGGFAGVAGMAALAGMARSASAGPLNPPAGPVISTGKTLAEAEPRIAVNATNTPGDAANVHRITQPGSYYLAGNITGVAGKNGISIESGGVTLDLNGFSLNGVPGALDGVRCPVVVGMVNIAVVNGTMAGWPGHSVEFFSGGFGIFRDLLLRDSGALRIGSGSIVQRCVMFQGPGDGIHAGPYSTVDGCTVYGKAGTGIVCMTSCIARGCEVSQCGGPGIRMDQNSRVERCNVTYNNTGAGAGGGGIVSASQNVTVIECSCASNTGHGIALIERCTVTRCHVGWNTGSGISGTFNTSVIECDAYRNNLHGIDVTHGMVLRCSSTSNNNTAGVSAGIRIASGRVEGCHASGNVKGYEGTGNALFLCNQANGNSTNYVISSGCAGLFVNPTPFVTPVNGSTGGAGPSSGDPRANFSM